MNDMTIIFLAILVALLAGHALFTACADLNGDFLPFLGMSLGVLLILASGLSAVAYAFTAWSWFAAGHRASIINREYGTKYTQEEVFYASDVIDTIRQLDRKRIEINGDLMRDKEDAP